MRRKLTGDILADIYLRDPSVQKWNAPRIAALNPGVPLPDNYPVVGRDAFRTGTGVHAAAIIKARARGEDWLADRVYSSVPASMIGCRQVIEVGPMSGESNVVYWLQERGAIRTRVDNR